ncbi:16S rRNA (cytosine(1402)-N(4))-methyltransferase RsmH [Micrococcus porci]|uniref:16S rRNA (cytosine(1402)-N(4))-methyltransferase RsmH n=1 Tax=Micrococcus TaxID=1269 RepID=UPI001CCB8EC0|nr:16S rRNA (cytosine(1402)-N(4))-methyltransferase RsmH [Micrococcus porci]MCG7422414.1 16S rRNA (cytosine(1402)-N(4))-methyltransferase RsmH [Micrococcus sp. ACRRV]UBH23683.1 16S rRNA (cytosine(1402)-N(4))-methyltransferase RsmH [Micrococcus porci]
MDPTQPLPRDRHVPVMRDRVVDLLAPAVEAAAAAGRTPVAVDGTLGMGGHTEVLLRRFPTLRVVGIDRDPNALAMAQERLGPLAERLVPFHGTYDQVPEALAAAGAERMDAALYDLGVSSYQLDARERGFAYSYDAPLDMRMDTTAPVTAADLVAELDEQSLRRIIRRDGEDRFAGPIARAIVRAREEEPILTTGRLVDVIRAVVPVSAGNKGGHPAKRTFQALRIAVNEELDILDAAVPAVLDALEVGGRLVVMSYHSLEDRIAKRHLQEWAASTAPPGFPVELPEHRPLVKVLTRGTEKPTEEEIEENRRASSAKVRAVEKIRTSRTTA